MIAEQSSVYLFLFFCTAKTVKEMSAESEISLFPSLSLQASLAVLQS